MSTTCARRDRFGAKRRAWAFLLGPTAFAALTGAASPARADGLYGRFDGDVMLAAGVGAGAGFRESGVDEAGVVEVRLRYLDSVGPVVAGEWSGAGFGRVLLGLELRPLFPSLFLLDQFTGDEWLDLTVQSLSLDLGAAFEPLGTEGEVGAAFFVGLAVEFPLVLPSHFGQGLFVRVFSRHIAASQSAASGPTPAPDDWVVGATLVIRGALNLGLGSREQARFRAERR